MYENCPPALSSTLRLTTVDIQGCAAESGVMPVYRHFEDTALERPLFQNGIVAFDDFILKSVWKDAKVGLSRHQGLESSCGSKDDCGSNTRTWRSSVAEARVARITQIAPRRRVELSIS